MLSFGSVGSVEVTLVRQRRRRRWNSPVFGERELVVDGLKAFY
jgi:hypothetical protein